MAQKEIVIGIFEEVVSKGIEKIITMMYQRVLLHWDFILVITVLMH